MTKDQCEMEQTIDYSFIKMDVKMVDVIVCWVVGKFMGLLRYIIDKIVKIYGH